MQRHIWYYCRPIFILWGCKAQTKGICSRRESVWYTLLMSCGFGQVHEVVRSIRVAQLGRLYSEDLKHSLSPRRWCSLTGVERYDNPIGHHWSFQMNLMVYPVPLLDHALSCWRRCFHFNARPSKLFSSLFIHAVEALLSSKNWLPISTEYCHASQSFRHRCRLWT